MSEHLSSRQRRREFLITVAYSIFTVLMIIVTNIERWPFFYVPLLVVELAFVWWSYTKKFKSYNFRAFLITSFVSLNVLLYGIQGENFFVLIPTLCTEFVLLSLYEITRIMDVVMVKSIVLFLYHLIVKGYTLPEGHLERNRIMLQSVSYIVLILLCMYRIRHHHQEEQDVVDLEVQVEREKKIRDDFVANTSHELRTPVNTISGMCEIMLQKNLPDDIHSGVLDIQMTGVELQNIVTDILDYASLEADTLVLHPRIYNITSTLNDVMNMTTFENKDKQLEIIFDCDPNIPSQLEGDEQQLRRILNNLIGNAIKFTSEGGVIVRVTYRSEAYGINLIVSVKDTGVGINIDEQELILKGFYQTDSDRNRKSSGMGLGLPITSALIRKMGGFLTIKSQEGIGSEFAFAIPQKVVNDSPCISIMHPASIKLIWFYNSKTTSVSMRDAFADHIQHFSESFGLVSHRATSLEECKRRVAAQGQGVHLIIGENEYNQDKEYFNKLSPTTPIILIAEGSVAPKASQYIHVLHKPYNAIMLAEIFNGKDIMATKLAKKEPKKFIAPTSKILVVDDNLMNLKVVEGLLRKYRIKVVAATSGEEALSLIDSKDYDFVFMDHMMPGMDGVECFHHIRNKAGTYFAQLPIIALTANAIAGSREMFLSEGFNEFIAKPIDTAALNEILHRFIPIEKQLTEEDIRYLTDDKPEGIIDVNKAAEAPPREEPAETQSGHEEEKVTEPTNETDDIFARLPKVDKETALIYCGEEKDFLELAEIYLGSGKNYTKDLNKFFEEGNYKSYAIIAHSIKGTSKTLGIAHLSDLALDQELAAKDNRAEDVKANHEAFISEYESVLDMFSAFFSSTENLDDADNESTEESENAQNEIKDWNLLKAELMTSLESYEVKAFEEALAKAKGKTLKGNPVEDVLSGVKAKVAAFDYEGAIASLEEIGGAS